MIWLSKPNKGFWDKEPALSLNSLFFVKTDKVGNISIEVTLGVPQLKNLIKGTPILNSHLLVPRLSTSLVSYLPVGALNDKVMSITVLYFDFVNSSMPILGAP